MTHPHPHCYASTEIFCVCIIMCYILHLRYTESGCCTESREERKIPKRFCVVWWLRQLCNITYCGYYGYLMLCVSYSIVASISCQHPFTGIVFIACIEVFLVWTWVLNFVIEGQQPKSYAFIQQKFVWHLQVVIDVIYRCAQFNKQY